MTLAKLKKHKIYPINRKPILKSDDQIKLGFKMQFLYQTHSRFDFFSTIQAIINNNSNSNTKIF